MTDCDRAVELMSALIDGEADEAGLARLREHLESCPECRELMAAMRGAHRALRFELEPPAELKSSVMEGVKKLEAKKRAGRRRFIGAMSGLAAAAVLAAVIIPMGLRAGNSAPEAGADDPGEPALFSMDGTGTAVEDDPGGTAGPGAEPDVMTVPSAIAEPEGKAAIPIPIPEPAPEPEPEPEDGELVDVTEYIPGIFVDLRYATEDNFTGTVIYDSGTAYLRYGTVKKLAAAQEELSAQGLSLLIWDATRPVEAQFRLWEVCPDARYVADPNKGYSSHSRGNTVDVALVREDGSAVELPTDFDDFTALADRDYSDVSEAAAENAGILEEAMTNAGFEPYSAEWWHYSDTDTYDIVSENP